MKKNIFKKLLFIFFVTCFLFLVTFFTIPVLAWDEPNCDPGEICPVPLKIITTSDEAQTKAGALTVSTTGNANYKGLSVGDYNNPIIYTKGQNLIYGVIKDDVLTKGNLMLLQTGIGNDKFKIDKDGNVIVSGKICFQEDCKSKWEEVGLPIGASGQTLRYNSSKNLIANDVIFNNGNFVGVGTTDPKVKLDINGVTRVNSLLQVGGADTAYSDGRRGIFVDNGASTSWEFLTLQNNDGVAVKILRNGNITTKGNLTVTGTATSQFFGAVKVVGNGTDKGLMVGNIDFPFALTGNQNLIYGKILSGAGNANLLLLQNDTGGEFKVDKDGNVTATKFTGDGSSLTGVGYWDKSGNNISNKNTGNVGIGATPTNGYKLDVVGDVRVGSNDLAMDPGNVTAFFGNYNSGADADLSFQAGGSSVMTLKSGGKVKISKQLSVGGYDPDSNWPITTPKINVGYTSNTNGQLTVDGGLLDLTYQTTTAPDVSATNFGRIYFDKNTNKFKVSENAGAFKDLVGGIPGGTNGAVQFNNSGVFGGDNANLFWDNTNKRLGIGTTTPGAKLEVVNTMMVSAWNPYLYINGNYPSILSKASIGIPSAGEIVMRSNTNNASIADWEVKYGTGTRGAPFDDSFYIGRRSAPANTLSTFFQVNSYGNVGIGTTTPGAYKLNVNGDTNITGKLNVTGTATSQFSGAVKVVGNGTDKGLMVGNIDFPFALTGNQNLIYGKILSGAGNANLLLLQNDTGGEFKVDKDGNVTATKFTGDGSSLTGVGYWDKSGNNISNKNTGNVGIGTTGPGSPLEISSTKDGILRLRQNEAGNVWNYIEWYNSTARQWFTGVDTSGNFQIGRDNAPGNVIIPTGNVGIGTTAPSSGYKLDVAGDVRVGSNDLAMDPGNVTAFFGNYNSGADADLSFQAGGSSVMTLKSGGKVKISKQLSVGGYDPDSNWPITTPKINVGYTSNTNGQLTVDGGLLDLTYQTTTAPDVSATNFGRIYFDKNTNKFKVSENAGAFKDLVGGIPGGTNGAVQFNNSGVFGGDNANLFWDNTNKRLGIGTTTPQQKLDVKGNIQVIGDIYGGAFGATRGIWRFNTTYPDYGIFYTEATPDVISISPNGGGVTSPSMVISGDKVGIGTTAPGAKLHISQTSGTALKFDNRQLITFNQNTNPETKGNIIGGMGFYGFGVAHAQFHYRVGKGFEMLNVSNDAPSISHESTVFAPLYLSNLYTTGNVGIGTTTPGAYKLNVNGDTNITGKLNVTDKLTAKTYEASNVSASIYYDKDNTNYYVDPKGNEMTYSAYFGKGIYSEASNNYFAGNIGIGTTDPGAYKLNVNGSLFTSNGIDHSMKTVDQLQNNTTLQGGIYQNSGDGLKNAAGTAIAFGNWWHVINMHHQHNNGYNAQIAVPLSAYPNDILFRTSGDKTWTEWRKVLSENVSGKVGIGTTTPGAKLDISGGIARENGYNLAEAATNNLLVNGDFEQGSTYGWSALDSVVTGGYSGNYAAQRTGSSTVLSDDYIPVDPTKDVFQLEGYFKKTVAGTTPGRLYFGYIAYNASKSPIKTAPCGTYCYFATSGYVLPVDDNWHKFSATTIGEGTSYPNFPIGTKFVRVLVLINYGASVDAVTQMDHVTLKRINFGPLFVGNNFNSTNLADQHQTTKLYTTNSNNFIIEPPSSGNVGIGTTTPGAYKLNVYGASGTYPMRIGSPDGYLAFGPANAGWSHFVTNRPRFYFNTGVTVDSGNIGSYNENLSLQTSGTTQMTILNSNGNVGIGTTAPGAYKLNVNGDTNITGKLNVTDKLVAKTYEAENVSASIYYDKDNTNYYVDPKGNEMTYSAYFGKGIYSEASNNYFAGNIGIGTMEPDSRRLKVYTNDVDNDVGLESIIGRTSGTNYAILGKAYGSGADNNIGGLFSAKDATANYGLRIWNVADTSTNYALYSDSPAKSYFQGNVGIGTATPAYKLDLVGSFGGSSQSVTKFIEQGRNVTPWDQTFEENITGWGVINNSSVARSSSTQAYEGDFSLRIKRNSLTGSGGSSYALGISLKPGRVYTLSGYYKMVNGTSTAMIKLNSNASNSWTNGTAFTNKALVNASGWTFFSSSITAATITTGNNYIWLAYNMATVDQEIYFDNLVFSEGSLPRTELSNMRTSISGLSTNFIGNVGIGTTDPGAYKLNVNGDTNITGKLNVTGTFTAGTFVATNTKDCNSDTTCNVNNLNVAKGGDITGVDKLTVATIDPLYEIKGKKYATYVSAIVGGVNEEYIGKAELKTQSASWRTKLKTYEYIIDFSKEKEGTDLWVWRKAIDFSKDNVNALVTPYGMSANIYYLIEGEKLIFRSDKPAEFSFRLIGKRFDWKQWPTFAKDQNEKAGLIIK